jgi:hypothetical protein
MTTEPITAPYLRKWAKGDYATEAATELLIRAMYGRFAGAGNPWVKKDGDGYWIEFDEILDNIGPLSSGERRILQIAASIGSFNAQVSLKDALWSLDDDNAMLVVAAIAHSANLRGRQVAWPA